MDSAGPRILETTTERLVIVDALRGLALVGVLFANFTGYTDQQVPKAMLLAQSDAIDDTLMDFNAIVIEYKFITLFCLLFGYSFGLLMDSIQRHSSTPYLVFSRRMMFLLLIGLIHCSFWWFDVLHVYAICGLFMPLFFRQSMKTILGWSIILFLGVPFAFFLITHGYPDTLTDADNYRIYMNFKTGDLFTLIRTNWVGYYAQFIASGENLYFFPETLGIILLGFLLYRIEFFKTKNLEKLAGSWLWITGAIAVAYLTLKYAQRADLINVPYYVRPFIQIGVLGTTSFYCLLLIGYYLRFQNSRLIRTLASLGRMTLTNYLLISAAMIITLYGVGFSMLGELPMRLIWLLGIAWLLVEILFSSWWLSRFQHGPLEGLWRRVMWWGKKKV